MLVVRTPLGTVLGLSTGPPCEISAGGHDPRLVGRAGHDRHHRGRGGHAHRRLGQRSRRGRGRALDPEPDSALPPAAARATYRALPDVATPDAEQVALAEALLGHDNGALTCTVPLTGTVGDRQDPTGLGLTPRADGVRASMREVFGKQILGGFSPRGVTSGHIEGSAHYEGRAVDIFFRPVTRDNQRLGWQQALWAVAHAERLDLATVIFDRRVWTGRRSLQGWRDYRHPSGETDNPVLMHEDHVHVDVVEGG